MAIPTRLARRVKARDGFKSGPAASGPDTVLDRTLTAFDTLTADQSSLLHREFRLLPVERLERGRFQPRSLSAKGFTDESLDELAESIRAVGGVVQPIVVRSHPEKPHHFEIVVGERRWRASQRVGLAEIPSFVIEVDDRTARVIALIENVQREDLDPIDEAIALREIKDEHGYSLRALARAIDKKKTWIDDRLKLLTLSPAIQEYVRNGDLLLLAAGYLTQLPKAQQLETAERAIKQGWSRRQLKRVINEINRPNRPAEPAPYRDPDLVRLEQQIAEQLALPVKLRYRAEAQQGELVLKFSSLDELDRLLTRLKIESAR